MMSLVGGCDPPPPPLDDSDVPRIESSPVELSPFWPKIRYVIIEVSPPPPLNCHLLPILPDFQPLYPLYTPPLTIGSGPKNSKRQKTGSEEIAAGVAVVLVDLCSGNQKGQKYLKRIVYKLFQPMMMKLR